MLGIDMENIVYAQATDRTLWHQFKDGDDRAFAAIYHRYFEVLIKACLHISKDREMIKDSIHDLFVEIWLRSNSLVLPVSVKAYLIRSIQRKMFRCLKQNRRYYSSCTAEVSYGCDSVSSIEEKIITGQFKQEQIEVVRKSIRMLTSRQQEAVYLKYYANLSYPDIAGKMCISTEAIYNLISKAIGNIQESVSKANFPTY